MSRVRAGFRYRAGRELDDGRVGPAFSRRRIASRRGGRRGLQGRSRDYVHAKGLQFGIHLMRGIPRQAVARNLPVEGNVGDVPRISPTRPISVPGTRTCIGVDMAKPGRAGLLRLGVRAVRGVGRRLREGGRHQPPLSRATSGDRGHPAGHRPHGAADRPQPLAGRDGAHRGRARATPRQHVAHQRRLLGQLAGAARAIRRLARLEPASRPGPLAGRRHAPARRARARDGARPASPPTSSAR